MTRKKKWAHVEYRCSFFLFSHLPWLSPVRSTVQRALLFSGSPPEGSLQQRPFTEGHLEQNKKRSTACWQVLLKGKGNETESPTPGLPLTVKTHRWMVHPTFARTFFKVKEHTRTLKRLESYLSGFVFFLCKLNRMIFITIWDKVKQGMHMGKVSIVHPQIGKN